MIRKSIVLFIFAASLVSQSIFCQFLYAQQKNAAEGKVLTLSECYDLALSQMETIAIDAQRIKEAEAHFLQALAIIMPCVSFISSD